MCRRFVQLVEMENHGTDPRIRGKLMDECLQAMIEMWTKEEPEFHGRYVDFDPIGIWPKPAQKPYPPIYVGGGRPAFERVARLGDAWLANGLPPGKLEPMMDELREAAGREVPVSVFNASSDSEDLKAYARLGVERVLLGLPTLPERDPGATRRPHPGSHRHQLAGSVRKDAGPRIELDALPLWT